MSCVGLLVFIDEDLGEECLVRQALPLIVCLRVERRAVGQESERGGDLRAGIFVSIVLVRDATVDVGDSRPDAELVPLEGVEVDGVGEVGFEKFVALSLQALPICREVGHFLRSRRQPLVEGRVYLGGQRLDLIGAECDVVVAASDKLLSDIDGYGTACAIGALRRTPGADEVPIPDALLVRREVELHA